MRRIIGRRGGGCTLRLPAAERALLASVPAEVDKMLATLAEADLAEADDRGEAAGRGEMTEPGGPISGDNEAGAANAGEATGSAGPANPVPPSLRRLFPPAYTRDDEAEASYVAMSRAGLLEHHRHALHTLATTASAKSLDDEQANEWMTALNDVRLVLGTLLDINEEAPPPRGAMSEQMVIYYYLTSLQDELVDFLAGELPPPVPGSDDSLPDDPWGEPPGGLRWDGTPQPTEGP